MAEDHDRMAPCHHPNTAALANVIRNAGMGAAMLCRIMRKNDTAAAKAGERKNDTAAARAGEGENDTAECLQKGGRNE